MDLNLLIEKIKARGSIQLKNEQLGVDKKVFIVEGDVGLNGDAGVAKYAKYRIDLAKGLADGSREEKQGLLGIEEDGRLLRWAKGKELSYCVWRPSFPDGATGDKEYNKVVLTMQQATADWEGICDVEFRYDSERDTKENLQLGEVLFPVVRQAGGGNTIAMAFFPSDEDLADRVVWAFDGFFAPGGGGFDPTGVMRHELGHVLGFRHEHIRPEAPDLFNPESTEHTVEITQYDPLSVMHYVAEGIGNPALTFTDADTSGSRQVYGPPDSACNFKH